MHLNFCFRIWFSNVFWGKFQALQKMLTTSTRGAMEARAAAEPWPRAPIPKEIKKMNGPTHQSPNKWVVFAPACPLPLPNGISWLRQRPPKLKSYLLFLCKDKTSLLWTIPASDVIDLFLALPLPRCTLIDKHSIYLYLKAWLSRQVRKRAHLVQVSIK